MPIFDGTRSGDITQSGSDVITMDSSGRVTFPVPFAPGVVPVVTMTGGNGESLSFVYGGPIQPDNTGFGFYANQQNGTAITSGGVRVCWIAVGRVQ